MRPRTLLRRAPGVSSEFDDASETARRDVDAASEPVLQCFMRAGGERADVPGQGTGRCECADQRSHRGGTSPQTKLLAGLRGKEIDGIDRDGKMSIAARHANPPRFLYESQPRFGEFIEPVNLAGVVCCESPASIGVTWRRDVMKFIVRFRDSHNSATVERDRQCRSFPEDCIFA